VLSSIVESSFKGSSLYVAASNGEISVGILTDEGFLSLPSMIRPKIVRYSSCMTAGPSQAARNTVSLYQYDCVTPADSSLSYADYSTLGEISVDLDIIQDTLRRLSTTRQTMLRSND
jgi:hypothetical protein